MVLRIHAFRSVVLGYQKASTATKPKAERRLLQSKEAGVGMVAGAYEMHWIDSIRTGVHLLAGGTGV